MPDLQSELAKLATAWDDHEQTIRTPNQTQPKQEKTMTSTTQTQPVSNKFGAPIRNNIMRTCFDLVQLTPGKTVQDLVAILEKQGFKTGSTTSVLYQLVRTGQIIKSADGKLTPNPAVKTYQPITLPSTRVIARKAAVLARKKQLPANSAGIAALSEGTGATLTVVAEDKRAPRVESIIAHRSWTPESVLDKLTLPQAKQLHEALKIYFG